MPNVIFEQHKGLADSIYSGIKDSYAKSVGIDFHSIPGALTVHQALSKHSGATITELCKVVVGVSDGSKLWFSSTSGKIWRELSGAYELVYTTSAAAGGSGCSGASEFNGRIYWATESRVHYIAVANIGSTASWTANAQPNAHIFSNTDNTYHPMQIVNNELFIGDKIYVAGINSVFSFTANRLDIIAPHRIRVLKPFDVDLLIGTIISENVNDCQFIRWDTVQDSWQFAQNLKHNGIRAAGYSGEIPIFIVGSAGRIYYYDGERLKKWKRLPGSWSGSAYYDVNPNAVELWDDRAIIGVSNGSGNPIDQGIYDLGSYSADYSNILSQSHVISSGAITAVQIGAIISDGLVFYISWYDGTNYGVDKLDLTAKYALAYLESRVIRLAVNSNQPFTKALALYQTLNGGSLTFSYKKNHAAYVPMTSVDESTLNQIAATDMIDARVIQIKMAFTVSGNNAPVVEGWGASISPAINNDATK